MLMAVNYNRIGKSLKSNMLIYLTPLVTLLLVAAGLFLPAGTPTFLIPLLIALGVQKISKQEFGEEIAAIETNGGRFESSWIVVGSVIAGIIASLAIVIGLLMVLNIG